MNQAFEESWETASEPQKLRLLATNVVNARVSRGQALSEFRDVLGFYSSGEWMQRGVPVEALNQTINDCRHTFEMMENSVSVAIDRLHEAVVRSIPRTVESEPVVTRLVMEAFARHGTDHSIENFAVKNLLAEYAPEPEREYGRSR